MNKAVMQCTEESHGMIRQAIINEPSSRDSKTILENEMSFLYHQPEMDQTVLSNGEEWAYEQLQLTIAASYSPFFVNLVRE